MLAGSISAGVWLGFWGGLLGYQGMLLWSLAAAIPLLLHLWSRRQRRETSWAAMQFLRAALQKHARRLRVEQLMLLALRMAPLALLGLALADPEAPWLGSGLPGRQRRQHHVMVIDASFSMLAEDGSGVARFERARQSAREWMASTRPGDGLSLVVMDDSPRVLNERPVLDKQEMLAELERLNCGQGGAAMPATASLVVTHVRQLVEAEPQWDHEVVWLSDFAANSWSEAAGAAAESIDALGQLARIRLEDVSAERGLAPANLAVASLQVREPLPVASAPVTLEATVLCFGRSARVEGEAVFFLDGEEVGRRRVSVARGGSQQVALPFLIPEPGEHWLKVELESAEDALPLDNARSHIVRVRERLRALCIEGRTGEARETALALSPSPASPIEVEVASETALAERELASYDCIVLLNLGRITSNDARQLVRFVQSGGGLLAFVGDLVQAESWNGTLFDVPAERRVLPARLLQAKTDRQGLDPLGYRHPIVAIFEGRERAGFRSTPVTRYFPLQPDERATPIFSTSKGDIIAFDGRLGNGRCLLFGISASSQAKLDLGRTPGAPGEARWTGREPWSQLSQWPSFLPLMQRAFVHAARQDDDARNTEVGRPITGYATGRSLLTLVEPSGQRRQLPVVQDRWSFADTAQAGVYRVEAIVGQEPRQLRAVNVATTESDLTPVEKETLPDVMHWDAAPVTAEAAQPSNAFRWLLAIVLALLLTESWYANRLARGGV